MIWWMRWISACHSYVLDRRTTEPEWYPVSSIRNASGAFSLHAHVSSKEEHEPQQLEQDPDPFWQENGELGFRVKYNPRARIISISSCTSSWNGVGLNCGVIFETSIFSKKWNHIIFSYLKLCRSHSDENALHAPRGSSLCACRTLHHHVSNAWRNWSTSEFFVSPLAR